MRKYIAWILFMLFPLVLCSCCFEEDYGGSLHWVRRESRFVDYYIDGDTVVFRYLLVFHNDSEYDYIVYSPQMDFPEDEVCEWIALPEKGGLRGYFPNNEYECRIRMGTIKRVIVTITGRYLGGEVNENLSLPIKFVYSCGIVDPEYVGGTGMAFNALNQQR